MGKIMNTFIAFNLLIFLAGRFFEGVRTLCRTLFSGRSVRKKSLFSIPETQYFVTTDASDVLKPATAPENIMSTILYTPYLFSYMMITSKVSEASEEVENSV